MIRVAVENSELLELIKTVVSETTAAIAWPVGRIALTENEAAQALGIGRHVLRDLRLAGSISHARLGKRIVYSRSHLLELLRTCEVTTGMGE